MRVFGRVTCRSPNMKTNRSQAGHRVLFGLRTRILTWYVVLMAVSAIVSIVVFRHVLFDRVERRIEKSLVQEVEEFRKLTKGRNPETGQLFEDDVTSIFEIFLNRNVPDDDEFLITLLNGQLYRSSPRALPDSLSRDSKLVNYWATLTKPEGNEVVTPDGIILYLAEPVIKGKTRGVFVVAQSTAGELHEVDEAVIAVIEVTVVVLAVTLVLAWVAAGRVLAPLRLLKETARSISESDLTRRIPVQGSDEIAELTITFNEMLNRLQTAFAGQRDFINDAGHELRTPITIIRGHLELLGDDPEEQRETVELVTDELDRMSRFVNDLLLLAKAEQPNFLILETVDIGLLTEELYTKITALANRNWRMENKGSGLIVVDRQRITQAMMNLAQNATQHTTDGDAIAIGSVVTRHCAHLWVRDTGVGIDLAEQERIFERFARGSDSRRRSEGAGLGLAIVQTIAAAHGGQVKIFSRPGGGSTFTIILPLDPPAGAKTL